MQMRLGFLGEGTRDERLHRRLNIAGSACDTDVKRLLSLLSSLGF